jgi:CubicO group peptidase (beta-lactamase class C family)
MSKTITATAVVAMFEDLAHPPPNTPSLGVTLDSSIRPYLPSIWKPANAVDNVTFRMVLRHTAGFCAPNTPQGDSYAAVQSMIESGPSNAWKGAWHYCNSGFALLRILLPYVVDGPTSYQPFESNAMLNATLTAMSYRNYVRGRIFAPLGLAGVDAFFTGADPSTIYFDANKQAIPDQINISGTGYDLRANNHVLTAGSGNWTLSAEEYSLFIAALWQGKIVSPASVATMLAQDDPKAQEVGIGMYSSQLTLPDGTSWWNYNTGGGGGLGGPQGIWMTFFNGYTAVLLTNTAWGLPATMGYQLMEQSFASALTPSNWTCNVSYYNKKDGCDCNCGAWDPDCNAPGTLYGCSAGQHCVLSGGTGVCAP